MSRSAKIVKNSDGRYHLQLYYSGVCDIWNPKSRFYETFDEAKKLADEFVAPVPKPVVVYEVTEKP